MYYQSDNKKQAEFGILQIIKLVFVIGFVVWVTESTNDFPVTRTALETMGQIILIFAGLFFIGFCIKKIAKKWF
jgi:hypothetical protein